MLWKTAIYKEKAFGQDKWSQSLGMEVKGEDIMADLSSLPVNEFIKDSRNFQREFKKSNCLMLVRLPTALTLKTLNDLLKKLFSTSKDLIPLMILNMCESQQIEKPIWIIVIKYLLPRSRLKSYEQQAVIVKKLVYRSLIDYKISSVLEAVICNLINYLSSDKSRKLHTYTCVKHSCVKATRDFVMGIGRFSPEGLDYWTSPWVGGNEHLGITAVRRFRDKNFFNPELDETMRPFDGIPTRFAFKIFYYLNLASLGKSCLVSKTWNRLASNPMLWKISIYREMAFGNRNWSQYFGLNAVVNEDRNEEFYSLLDRSYWVIITKVLPTTRMKDYIQQEKIIDKLIHKKLINYTVPETLEAEICYLAAYLDSKKSFINKSMIFTRCKNSVQGTQTAVGISLDGPGIKYSSDPDENIGMAALRKEFYYNKNSSYLPIDF